MKLGKKQSEPDDPAPSITGLETLEEEIKATNLAALPHSGTLTANEVYVIERAGYQILQVVYGTIVYSMGLRGAFRSFTRVFRRGEMSDFTRMINDARIIARNRMLQHAEELGAHLVLDVNIDFREFADFVEVTCTGTAVKRVRQPADQEVAISA